MNILVTTGLGPSIHSFGNMGDIAMLQAGLSRLAKLWPNATLNVLTEWPEELLRYCPLATPLPAAGRDLWVGEDILLGRYTRFVPRPARNLAVDWRRRAAFRFPRTLKWCLNAGLRIQRRHGKRTAVSAFRCALETSDFVVACGAGGFYQGCRGWNMETLDTIEAGLNRNIPVAMMGQHFGPLTDPEVVSRAKHILPAVNLITLRGNPGARTFLESLGVPPSRIRVTGDEAIELAYGARPPRLGNHVGVNFRLRTSAETTDNELEIVRSVLYKFAASRKVSLVPVPISVDSSTSDHRSITQLLKGVDSQSDGGAHLRSPLQVIEQVGGCKILITCAYHAAVFALSQGISVIALAKSGYFTEKFLGLKNQFGLGCEIISLTAPDLPQSLFAAMEVAWLSAQDMRLPLQQAAVRQIGLIWNSYSEIKKLVTESGRRKCQHAEHGISSASASNPSELEVPDAGLR